MVRFQQFPGPTVAKQASAVNWDTLPPFVRVLNRVKLVSIFKYVAAILDFKASVDESCNRDFSGTFW